MKIAYVPAIAVFAAALVACAGGSSRSTSNSMTVANKGAASASDGARVYQTNCSSCHGATGDGSPAVFPPLAGNPIVVGTAAPLIHIVKFGLQGSITVKGTPYNGTMPAWGGQLSDGDIAAAITFIRSSWGNKAAAVSEADVTTVKQ